MSRLLRLLAATLLALAQGTAAQYPRAVEDEPSEYRDRKDQQEAYRRGYERGYDRGFQRGLEEGRRSASARPPAAVAPPPPPPPTLGPIKVTSAFYGSFSKNCDATRWVARRADGKRQHSFKVTNDMCGDPHHGQRKTLEVVFWCGEVSRTASAREHQDLFLNCLN